MDAETGAPIALPASLQGSGKLYFHPDGKRILGNFGQPPRLSWVDFDTGYSSRSCSPPAASMSSRCHPTEPGSPTSRRRTSTASRPATTGRRRTCGSCHRTGERPEACAVPVADLRPLVGPRRSHGRQRSGRRAQRSLDDSLDDPSHARRITSGQADEDGASTSADGRWLVYTDNREGATALVCRELETGTEQTLPVTRMDFGAPTGTLGIRFVEKGTGAPLTARVSVQQKDGKYFAPSGALYRMLGTRRALLRGRRRRT